MSTPVSFPGTRRDTLAVRLAALAGRATDRSITDDPVATTALLQARARALAMPRADFDDAAVADRLDVLVFLIGDDRLAMPLASIVAIIRAAIVTPLPRAVAPVFGVTAWRGRPLTVLSMGATGSATDPQRRLLVLGDGRRAVAALLVTSVDETRIVQRAALSPAPAGPRARLAMGMTDDAVLLLDTVALLNAARSEP